MDRRLFLVATMVSTVGVALAAGAHAQNVSNDGDPLVDTVAAGKGRINFSAGVIKASGSGAPPSRSDNPVQAKLMAIGAAKADALRNLAMAVSAVQVTATTRVKNYVTESDVIETKVTAILQGARVVSETIARDGTATVVVELPLYGKDSVAAAVLPDVVERDHKRAAEPKRQPEPEPVVTPERPVKPAPRRPRTTPETTEPLPAGGLTPNPKDPFKDPRGVKRITPEPKKPAPKTKNYALPLTSPLDEGPFTAVIIDCRGLGIQGILSPKLYDESGKEVYGTMEVDTEYAIEFGIVGYPRTVEDALRGKRAGEKPLIVQAIRSYDKFHTDPVVSNTDAARIIAADKESGFLNKCHVIFLVDPIK